MPSPARVPSSCAACARTAFSPSATPAKAAAARAEREHSLDGRVFPPDDRRPLPLAAAPTRSRSLTMSSIPISRARRLALAGVATFAFTAIPGHAQQAGTPITQTEAQQGAQYHEQFLQEFGGAMTGSQAGYVEQVGKNIAVQSGLANSQSAFNVTLLNSAVDNAFAVPGGYVYVTRQLVSLMNNETELAGVLGHEVGHVSAR